MRYAKWGIMDDDDDDDDELDQFLDLGAATPPQVKIIKSTFKIVKCEICEQSIHKFH